MPHELLRVVELTATAEEVFRWHTRPGAFDRLTPPWEPLEVVVPPLVENGARARFRLHVGPAATDWVAEVKDVRPGEQFADTQVEGPFSRWEHEHRFVAEDGRTRLEDHIVYDMPLGALGDAVLARSVEKRLERMFRYRHAVTAADLRAHKTIGPGVPLRVAITGATGLIGSALQPFLTTGGHEVLSVSRSPSAGAVVWDPANGIIDGERLEGVDAVVHLAGESVFGGRWSEAKRKRVRQSRIDGTRLIARAASGLKQKPRVLVCASGVGYYGDTGDRVVDERAERGEGFLAEVCEVWERAADPARDAGIRVVHLRFGVVLSPKGGALRVQLPLFRAGLGGPLSRGAQWQSFLGLDDVLDIVLRAIVDERLEGPVNAVAPDVVRQRELAAVLGKVLGRPARLPAPAFGLKLAFGRQQAEEVMLFGQRAHPSKLLEVGHVFRTPSLEETLRHCLGR